MAECAISSDYTKMALKVRKDYNSADRNIVIWDFESDNSFAINNPNIKNSTDVAVIDFDWSGEFLKANFLIKTDSDQHNELWQYKY